MLTTDTPIFNFPNLLLKARLKARLRALHYRVGFVCLICFLLSCSQADGVFVSEVIARENCDQVDTGVSTVNFKDVARVRGTELLNITADDTLSLFSISPGEKPTTGYAITLASVEAQLESDTIVAEFDLGQPQNNSSAQLTTTPCTIVALQRPDENITHFEARTTTGESIGRVAF